MRLRSGGPQSNNGEGGELCVRLFKTVRELLSHSDNDPKQYAFPIGSFPILKLLVKLRVAAGERKLATFYKEIANMRARFQQVAVRDYDVRHLARLD